MRTIRFLTPVLLALLAVSLGCSSTRQKESFSSAASFSGAPFFVTGPAGLLFTSYGDFSARVELDSVVADKNQKLLSGALLGQGSKLFFGPVASKKSKHATAENSYIWDAKKQTGFVASEPLQAYAPISSNVYVTNISLAHVEREAPQTIDGHDCRSEQATFQLSDGTTSVVKVWRAHDLNDFPLRVESMTGYPRQVANFSDVQFGHVAADLFLPPDGFTRYDNAGQMDTELIARRSTPKKNFVGNTDTGPLPDDHDYGHRPR